MISKHRKQAAFTRIELAVVIGTLGLLTLILLPALAQDGQVSKRIQCANNLKQISLAFRIWSSDYGSMKFYPMQVSYKAHGSKEYVPDGNAFVHFLVLAKELKTPNALICPFDNRAPAQSFEKLGNKNVSYFVGLDAQGLESKMILAGDRNLTNGITPVKTTLELRPGTPAGWTGSMHPNQGMVLLSEGSVNPVTTPQLRELLTKTGNSTNRIALPE